MIGSRFIESFGIHNPDVKSRSNSNQICERYINQCGSVLNASLTMRILKSLRRIENNSRYPRERTFLQESKARYGKLLQYR